MSPAAKFNAILASVTVLVMFVLTVELAPLLRNLGTKYQIVLPFVALVTSAGLYRILALAARWAMERSTWISKIVLGAHYLHGTWIGWFIGRAGDKRFTVEHYVQNIDELVIIGRSFTEKLDEHGYWESDTATIDVRKGKLIFAYSMDVTSRSTTVSGINTSLFDRESAYKPARTLAGIAHDLNDQVRIAFHAEKCSDSLLPWHGALLEAKKRFP